MKVCAAEHRCPYGCTEPHEVVEVAGFRVVACPAHPKDASPLLFDRFAWDAAHPVVRRGGKPS